MVALGKWVIRMIGCAKAYGTSNDQTNDTYRHLRAMSNLDKPEEYACNQGKTKPLFGPLRGWCAFKPFGWLRSNKRYEMRIVYRTKDVNGQKTIEVSSFGPRDGVYDHAIKNLASQRRKGKL